MEEKKERREEERVGGNEKKEKETKTYLVLKTAPYALGRSCSHHDVSNKDGPRIYSPYLLAFKPCVPLATKHQVTQGKGMGKGRSQRTRKSTGPCTHVDMC